ncbi:hypothetical protein VDG1235_3153 [Verrucomicrobiia bacterium DG1235]|nr:hypothetical protein VDG1235_3153 [Verrucomicrobiae bacterium DG1235]
MLAPRIVVALALLISLGFSSGALAKPKENQSVTIKRQIEPRYPVWAYTHGVGQGYAKIAFYVDENGEASEFLAIEYSYEAFADELMSTILKWDFVPAHREGRPVKSVCHAYWEFLPDRPIETNALFDTSKRMESGGSEPFRTVKFREEKELDERLGMLGFPGLIQVKGTSPLKAGKKAVRARISFFVDQSGQVALPHVVDTTDPEVSEELEAAFKKATFSVPSYKGNGVIALLERTYDIPVVWIDEEQPERL